MDDSQPVINDARIDVGIQQQHTLQGDDGSGGHTPEASPDLAARSDAEARREWSEIVRDVLQQQQQEQQEQAQQQQQEQLQQEQEQLQKPLPLSAHHTPAGSLGDSSLVGAAAADGVPNQSPRSRNGVIGVPTHQRRPSRSVVRFHADVDDKDEEEEEDDEEEMRPISRVPSRHTLNLPPLQTQRSKSLLNRAQTTPPLCRTPEPPASPRTVTAAGARSPSASILRRRGSASIHRLNFLPPDTSLADLHAQYPTLTRQDFDDIESFLDPAPEASARWTYASLFSWSSEKLALLTTAIQPEHLTLIAHRSMSDQVTSQPVDVAFRNLYCSRDGHTKLRGLSGYCKPGMMVAVWGAPDSGVGSLLALLAGCYRHTDAVITGELLFNGRPPKWSGRSARRQVGFVAKEAQNFATMTVAQTLYFSAKLRLPRLPENILHFRVGLVCKMLGLSHVRDSIVGSATMRGLSGGEAKRLAYGCELIVGYSLILCDQPTDGLDQPSALSLMQNFKLTCSAGRSMMTSLATASEPLFNLFDFVLLLSKGACLYWGPRVSVLQYLESQGFEPPEVAPPQQQMPLPDFLQALSATPEKFWRAHLPIQVRERPLPWLGKKFPFFADAGTARVDRRSQRRASFSTSKVKKTQYLLEVAERKLARQQSYGDFGAEWPAPAGGESIEMTALGSQHDLQRQHSLQSMQIVDNGEDADDALNGNGMVVPLGADPAGALTPSSFVPPRRLAWKRLVKGWRMSDFNADCAYVLDFDLQPLQAKDGKRAGTKAVEKQPLLSAIREPSPAPSDDDMGSPTASKSPSSPFLPQRNTFGTQLWLCLVRQAQFTYKNRGLWLYNWIKTLIFALVMGTLFYQMGNDSTRDVRPRFGMMYFIVQFYGNAAIQMISVLIASRTIVTWETFAGYYHPLAYSLALMLVFIPIALIEMFLFTVVVYPLAGLAGGIASVNFVYMWLVLTLSNLAGRGWILLFSSFLPTQSLANIIAPVINLLLSAFCGYLNPKDGIPAGWIWTYYMSYYTYAFRGLSLNEVAELDLRCPNTQDPESCAFQNGRDALALYSMQFDDPVAQKWKDAATLLGLYLGYQLLSALILLARKFTPPPEDSSPRDFGEKELEATASTADESPKKKLAAGDSGASLKAAVPLLDEESQLPVAPATSNVKMHTLSFYNLSYSVTVPSREKPTGVMDRFFGRKKRVQKVLLNNVCGAVGTGQLVALMGTSGAGKSTLMDVLTLKKTTGHITGTVLWDGAPLPSNFSSLVGLVDQFDSLHPQSTVRETLFFSGRLRLSSALSDAEVNRRVDEMLETLELTEQAHLRIGAVETDNLLPPEVRKKVSIGVELMADPMLLALDEPTTGLDSMSALLIARLMRKLSRRLPVVVTVHQPSNDVLAQFDVLLLLKAPGILAFYGAFDDAARFFLEMPSRYPATLGGVKLTEPNEGDNLADFVLGALKDISQGGRKSGGKDGAAPDEHAEVFSCLDAFLHSRYSVPLLQALQAIHGDEVRAFTEPLLAEQAAASPNARSNSDGSVMAAVPLPSKSLRATASSSAAAHESPNPLRALWLTYRELFRRHALTTVRSRRSLFLRLFTCTFYGFATGTLFYQLQLGQQGAAARLSLFYFFCRFSLFSGNLKLPGVFSTRVMLLRETSSRMYSTWSYAFARTLIDLPWVLVEMFIFSIIVYFTSDMSTARDGRLYALMYCTLLLNRVASLGFIELIGALTSTVELAQSLQTALNMMFMLFSGYFIPVTSTPQGWRWMNYLSPYYYAIRFIAHNEASQIDAFTCDEDQRVALPDNYDRCPVSQYMRDTDTKCNLQCGAELLDAYSIPVEPKDGYLSEEIGILLLFACAYPILAATALRFVNFVKR